METRTTSFEVPSTLWSEERERLLAARVDQLGLKIEGTRLEPLVDQLYAELEHAGIDVKLIERIVETAMARDLR
ncbi:MAG: hypothetical protein RLZZ450_6326 [Pseudomonadota bacterium]|jgi:uncharacterized protein (UPF0335 family)